MNILEKMKKACNGLGGMWKAPRDNVRRPWGCLEEGVGQAEQFST